MIGLYVGADWLACVAIARHEIVWRAGAVRVEDIVLEEQIVALLNGVPIRRLTRPSVYVALGPAVAPVKWLRGLPPVASPSVVRQLIEATPSRFFLVRDGPQVLADPERRANGWIVAVADAATVAAVNNACARRGLRQRGVRPFAILANRALSSGRSNVRINCRDGDVSLDVTCDDQSVASILRTSVKCGEAVTRAPALDASLEKLGDDAWRFAGAYAAARAGSSAPLLFRQPHHRGRSPGRMALRVASMTALATSAASMIFAPGIAAERTRTRNERALDMLRSTASSVAKDRIALEQQQIALRQLRAFVSTRRLVTPLLSALSLQLPDSTAIIALRVDTLGGTLVALSPVGAALVPAVSTTRGLDGLQLSAPITRELVGPLELERTALRFRFNQRFDTARVQRR